MATAWLVAIVAQADAGATPVSARDTWPETNGGIERRLGVRLLDPVTRNPTTKDTPVPVEATAASSPFGPAHQPSGDQYDR